MTVISVEKSRLHAGLLDATLRHKQSRTFQFLAGITREQLDVLRARADDERELREIASSKWAVRLPSLIA